MARVLIIDDDKLICSAISNVVKRMGHEVVSAHTLRDGLKRASSSDFDVVFLDVRMPDGSGLDVIPELQSTPSSPEIIIITGSGDPDGAE
ncbi:MAG: response regulator, partial [Nitrospirae bacterium]